MVIIQCFRLASIIGHWPVKSENCLFLVNSPARMAYQSWKTRPKWPIIFAVFRPRLVLVAVLERDNRPKWPKLFTTFRPTVLCNWISIWNTDNWFSYITLGKTYCQSSRRLYVSETSLPYGLVVYINLFIACFVQASDDRLLKMRIDHHNQQLLRLINRLFPIIGTSLVMTYFKTVFILLAL